MCSVTQDLSKTTTTIYLKNEVQEDLKDEIQEGNSATLQYHEETRFLRKGDLSLARQHGPRPWHLSTINAFQSYSTILTSRITTVAENSNYQWQEIGQTLEGTLFKSEFGRVVALSDDGNILAVASFGAVRVYRDDSGEWKQVGKDIVSAEVEEGNSEEFGFSIDLSGDGSVIAVGAPNANSENGLVRVFEWDITYSWNQLGDDILGTPEIPYPERKFRLGYSCALSNDGKKIAVGGVDRLNFGSGNVWSGHPPRYIRVLYYWKGVGWTQYGSDEHITGEHGGEGFGRSVALSSDGRVVAVGGNMNNGAGTDSGHVRVFQYDLVEDIWSQVGGDIMGEEAFLYFGTSISLSGEGTTLAVTGLYIARVFRRQSDSWNQIGDDIIREDASGLRTVLSSDGNTMAISVSSNFRAESDVGIVDVFRLNEGAWIKVGPTLEGDADGDLFGSSIAFSADGEKLVVGAKNGNSDYGQAKIFKLLVPSTVPTITNSALPSLKPTAVFPTASPSPERAPSEVKSSDNILFIGVGVGSFVFVLLLIFCYEKKRKEQRPGMNKPDTQGAQEGPATVVDLSTGNRSFDVFISHNWGIDEEGRDNHRRVKMINKSLKDLGIDTWLDEEQMHPSTNIFDKMSGGIEASSLVIVCVTRQYILKVAGKSKNGLDDNCKREFEHSMNHKGVKNMIPVVMEKDCVDSTKWQGPVGMSLGSSLYIKFISDDEHDDCIKKLMDEIQSKKSGTTNVLT